DDRLVGTSEALIAGVGRHLGPPVHAVAGVQVRTADSAAQHLQADLSAFRHGLGSILDPELAFLADDRLHRKNSVSSSLTRSGSSCCTQCDASGSRTTRSR